MRRSLTRIRTWHVGRLPPPKGWADMPARLAARDHRPCGDRRQGHAGHRRDGQETGRGRHRLYVGDGEFWTTRVLADYAAHITGVEARPVARTNRIEPGLDPRARRLSRILWRWTGRDDVLRARRKPMPRCDGSSPAVRSSPRGQRRSSARSTSSRRRSSARQGRGSVLPVLAPGWFDHFIFNEYYASDEEFLFALADAVLRNIARSWRPGSSCRSTIRASPTGGTC